MKRILITGASGFVGRALVPRLAAEGFELNLAGRTGPVSPQAAGHRFFQVGEVGRATDWTGALRDCDTVIHLAAQVPRRGIADELYAEVNAQGTARLVEQAAASGVKNFIHLSSIFAVTGNSAAAPIDENSPPLPVTSYGRSKLAAEQHVLRFSSESRKGVVLRPPLVYGAGARGNWRLLQRLAATGMPLPFGAIDNRRTLIAIKNLADAIVRVALLPDDRVKAGAYVVSDAQPVSLKETLAWLREGMGLPPRLLPVPESALVVPMRIFGMGKMARSLFGDLELDPSLFRETFGWSPAIAPREAIMRSGADFRHMSGAS